MTTVWEPVAEDGDINTWVSVEDNGRHIAVYVDDDRYAEETLPEGYALCRRVEVAQPQPVSDEVREAIGTLIQHTSHSSRYWHQDAIKVVRAWLDSLPGQEANDVH